MTLTLAVFGALLPPTSASAQTTFDNKPDLQTAADLWCSNETAALAEYGSIADWDVSRITDMSCLFSAHSWCENNGGSSTTGKRTCNPDIGSWDTSSVLGMSDMFRDASSFNKDISSWDTSAALDMDYMFSGAYSFDKDISSWNVSAVVYMAYMFYDASSLSDCNKALVHASFAAQTSAWYYSWGSLACPPPASPPASPTGVCGDGTALDAVTRKCEVSLGNGTEVLDGKVEVVLGGATEVLDGKVEVVLDEFTEVVGGKCAVACSVNRRLEEAQEEGAQEAAAASIVDGLLARHPDFVAKLRRANLDEEAIKIMLELGQDFRLPALA